MSDVKYIDKYLSTMEMFHISYSGPNTEHHKCYEIYCLSQSTTQSILPVHTVAMVF
jgi:hypothetical protein